MVNKCKNLQLSEFEVTLKNLQLSEFEMTLLELWIRNSELKQGHLVTINQVNPSSQSWKFTNACKWAIARCLRCT